MINTQLASQIANTQKNDLKVDNSASKDKTNLKDNPKEALAQALKQNLGKKSISCAELFEDVIDPYGQGEDIYRITARLIEKNVDVLLNKIESMRGER